MMKALVLFSGGVDSTTCLAMAIEKYGREEVLALSVGYGQKHSKELEAASAIADYYGVVHRTLDLSLIFEGSPNARFSRAPKRRYQRAPTRSSLRKPTAVPFPLTSRFATDCSLRPRRASRSHAAATRYITELTATTLPETPIPTAQRNSTTRSTAPSLSEAVISSALSRRLSA